MLVCSNKSSSKFYVNELVFLLDGERLAGFQTPEDFDLEDGDIEDGIQIDCRVRQEGGNR